MFELLPALSPNDTNALLALTVAAFVMLVIPGSGRKFSLGRTARTDNREESKPAGNPTLVRRILSHAQLRKDQSRRIKLRTGIDAPGPGSQQKFSIGATSAELLDLTGALLKSGVGIEAALDRLARCVPGAEDLQRVHRSLSAGAQWDTAWSAVSANSTLVEFGQHLRFVYLTGAPTVDLIASAARQSRSTQRQRAEQAAAKLGVKLVVPLGACFLPAFIVLGVVPVVIGLLPELP